MNRRTAAVSALVVLLVSLPVVALSAGNPNPRVLPPNSCPHGLSYGEWGAYWWQWVLGIPWWENPLLDDTGALAGVGQSGPVWMLVGTLGGPVERSCSVPTGKALFFPLVNFFDAGDFATLEDTEAAADFWVSHTADLWCTVDGVPLRGLFRYRGAGEMVGGLYLPEDNIFGAPVGTYSPAASDGYWLMLAPLPRGQHTIEFGGAVDAVNWDDFDPGLGWGVWPAFTVDVTYHLNVVGGPRGH